MCKVTQALLSPQLRLSCRTVSHLGQHHRQQGWVFYIQVTHITILVLKTFSLRHFAQPVVQAWAVFVADGANITLATAQGPEPTARGGVGRDEGLDGPLWMDPSVPTPASRGLQPAWKNSPLTQRASLCWFSLCCCCWQVRIKLLARECERQSTRRLVLKIIGPWKLKFDKLLIHAI